MNRAWKRVLAGWTLSLAVTPLLGAAETILPVPRSGSSSIITPPPVAVVNHKPIARLGMPVVSLGEPRVLAPQVDPALTPVSGFFNWGQKDPPMPLAQSRPMPDPMAGSGVLPMPAPLTAPMVAPMPRTYPAPTPSRATITLPNQIIDPNPPQPVMESRSGRVYSNGAYPSASGAYTVQPRTVTMPGSTMPGSGSDSLSGPMIVDGPVLSSPLMSSRGSGNINGLPPGTIVSEDGDIIMGADPTASWWSRTKTMLIGGAACGPAMMDEKHNLYRNRYFGSLEYIAWGIKGASMPSLVTGSTNPAAAATGAVIGGPGVQVLNPATVGNDILSGIRGQFGMWFTADQGIGMDTSAFGTEQVTSTDIYQSYGLPILGRPFFNTQINANDVQDVAVPSLVSGAVVMQQITQFYGGDANIRYGLIRGKYWTLDALTGIKYLSLRDRLSITESLYIPNTGGEGIMVKDQFSAQNNFFGGQIGGVLGLHLNRWSFDTTLKLAVGQNQVHSNIVGNTVNFAPDGTSIPRTGGLLAQQSNIGTYNFSETSFAPELGLMVGYNFNSNVKMMVGYNAMYWTNVVRSSGLIDTNVNPNQIPGSTTTGGAASPSRQYNTTDFWAQGISLGVEIKY